MSDDIRAAEDPSVLVAELRKESTRLARQLERLSARVERDKVAALSAAKLSAIRSKEQQKQEKYMTLLLASSPDILILLDNIGNVAYCTDAFLRRAGIADFETINGKTFESVFKRFADADWVDELAEKFAAAYAAGIPLSVEESMNMGGEARKYSIHYNPMLGNDGMVEGSVILLHDITDIEKARLEAEEARVAAERASAAKSEFLANMSHEMRTPMNAIIGMTNIAKLSSSMEKMQYCIGKIGDASTHLLGVINDILDMSKIEANKFDLSYTEFNFEKMIRKMVNVINFRVEEKKQNFFVHLDPAIPHFLESDEQRLAQVIANLLSNAVKFTPEEGSITLAADLVSEEDGDCMIRIDVQDSGIGIAPEQQSRLFKSFSQADSSTSRKFGGTGLGLAISKRIVEMMHGRIWLASTSGTGSKFSFTVHAKRGNAPKRPLLSPGVNWQTVRVLAVDDSQDILDYFSELAGQIGLFCDVAADGAGALAKIEENGPYDLYFVDWKMPGMDGVELARRIQAGAGGRSVVIMISATDWNSIEEQAKSAGVEKFLQKPLFASAIADCINECLGVGAQQTQQAALRRQADLEGYEVLLVEDIEINREIVLSVLEPSRLRITCAENGRQAVEMFHAAPASFDMILMDIHMPEMDGYEATRRIRGMDDIPQAKRVPIIAMTANVFREDIERCLAAGMNDHLGKPLDFDEVMLKLRQYLPRRAAAGPSPGGRLSA